MVGTPGMLTPMALAAAAPEFQKMLPCIVVKDEAGRLTPTGVVPLTRNRLFVSWTPSILLLVEIAMPFVVPVVSNSELVTLSCASPVNDPAVMIPDTDPAKVV